MALESAASTISSVNGQKCRLRPKALRR
jgi:hypothetical protein